jgi:hypothetical protein
LESKSSIRRHLTHGWCEMKKRYYIMNGKCLYHKNGMPVYDPYYNLEEIEKYEEAVIDVDEFKERGLDSLTEDELAVYNDLLVVIKEFEEFEE